MKICHTVYSLEMGGAEILVALLCRMQRANGHQVTICAYSKLGLIGEKLRNEGFDIYVPGEAHPARTMLRYLRYFRRMKPDVVHCHNPAPTLHAAWSAKLVGVPCVIATRHSLVAPPYNKAEEIKFGIASYACDSIVGVCEATCENLRRAPMAHRQRIVRVYNGVSAVPEAIRPLPDKSGFTLVFIGRLAAVKDLPTMLLAIELAVKHVPELSLWIIGDGPERARLEKMVQQHDLTKHVRFWGEQIEIAHFFRAADLFIMSSVSEGVPMSLLQAMSIGIPAVLTDVGGMAEVLQLSGSGMLGPVGDPSAMAKSIVQLAIDPNLRDTLSGRATASYHKYFTLTGMEAAYMQLYMKKRR